MFERFRQAANAREAEQSPSVKAQPKPFLIELQQREKADNGFFVPASRLMIDPSVRTSGLLQAVPPEELKVLLFLLTFVSPNGDCRAMLPQLAAAMHLSPLKARSRMQRLLALRWQGEPLVLQAKAESGLVAYVLHPRLVEYVEVREPAEDAKVEPPVQAASRDVVIAHSRRHYASTRAAAEREIARQLGHEAPGEENEATQIELHDDVVKPNQAATSPSPFTASTPTTPTAKPAHASPLRRRLENNGLTSEQADKLLSTYSWQRIEQQLGWLPFRNAKNPAAFLAAAIEGCYEEPRLLQRHGKNERNPNVPSQ